MERAFGHVVKAVSPDATGPCVAITYNPMILPKGVEPSTDPMLAARAAPYAVSLGRRYGAMLRERYGYDASLVLNGGRLEILTALNEMREQLKPEDNLLIYYAGHGVLMGLFGTACMFSPLITYVSRWFDRRRGTAIALISSGQYVAGVLWPTLFERGISSVAVIRKMMLSGMPIFTKSLKR